MNRPDLSKVEPVIRDYIEFLESQISRQAAAPRSRVSSVREAEEAPVSNEALVAESPTTINILTLSRSAIGKRTLRHLYARQHRSGMGIFDLDVDAPDYPALLASADEGTTFLLFTNLARAFRVPMSHFSLTDIRSKGTYVLDRIALDEGEFPVALLPERASGYIAMVTRQGKIRCLRHHLFGEHMKPGTVFFKTSETGPLASACWTNGDGDLFLLTSRGLAIRFNEKLVNPQGDWGIRLGAGDHVVAVSPVYDDTRLFLLGADGRGTLRLMSSFAANKSVGGGGKIAMKSEAMLTCLAVTSNDDLFAITRLGKIIRFNADEVPETEGTVQGVICMSMRADEVVSAVQSGLAY
jgi:DNA gyrase subunit A